MTTINLALIKWRRYLEKKRSPHTANSYYQVISLWARESNAGTKAVNKVTDEEVEDWINKKGEQGLSTRMWRLAALNSFFQFCGPDGKGWSRGNPAKTAVLNTRALSHAQKEKKRKRVWTDEEYNIMRAFLEARLFTADAEMNCSEDLRFTDAVRADAFAAYQKAVFWMVALTLGRATGLRFEDICNLEWDSLAVQGKLMVWTRKRETRVELDLPEEASEALSMIPLLDTTHCFPYQRDTCNNPHTRSQHPNQFKRFIKAAGLQPDLHFHLLRHTYATRCMEQGIPMPHIRSNLGHTSEKTTRGYVHAA